MLSIFVNLLALAVPLFTMQVYDRVVFHAGEATFLGLLIGVAVALVFDLVLRQARARILQRVAVRADVKVGRMLVEKFLSLPLVSLETRTAAYWHALFHDLETVRNTMSGSVALTVCDLPFALAFLALIFLIAPPIAELLMGIVVAFLIVAVRSACVTNARHKTEKESGLSRDCLINEIVAGRATVKALALDAAIRPMWEARHAECIERAIARGGAADAYANFGTTLMLVGTVTMTACGTKAILDQQLTIGGLIAASMLSGRVLGIMNQLVANWRVYAAYRHSDRRLRTLFAETGERRASAIRMARPNGVVRLDGVRFTYPGAQHPVIDGIDLEIPPGGMWAVMGRNGSGKTTLLKMLQGLYQPAAGRVLLDGADIRQFTRAELAGWIGYVPQECVLFAGNIRENIALRLPGASEDEVVRAAELSGLHTVIADLPDGYGTDIGEAGRRLSAGQRQRIAIARALVEDPPVLLLDEPSNGLDENACSELSLLLSNVARRSTVVVVTHDMQLLKISRTIVRMDRGRVVDVRPSEELLPHILGGRLRGLAA